MTIVLYCTNVKSQELGINTCMCVAQYYNQTHMYNVLVQAVCTCTCASNCIITCTGNTYECCIFSTLLELKCFGFGLVIVFFFLKRGCSRSPLSTVSGGLCSIQFSDRDLFLAPLLLYRGGFYNDTEREKEESKGKRTNKVNLDTLR